MNNTETWLDTIALTIEGVETELRSALRAMSRTENQLHAGPKTHTTAKARYGRTITIAVSEARAILHGLAPARIATTKLRRQHLRVAIASNNLVGNLVALNDPLRPLEHTLHAVETLLVEAREWHRQATWLQATRSAKVKGWRCPPLSITPVPQLQTLEQDWNLPSASAAKHRHQQTGQGYIELLQERRAAAIQLDLALPPPPSAEVIDLRQHVLALAA